MTLLEASGVGHDYDGTTVLDGVSLAIARGEIIGVVGPNGAGKSTLLRALAGILAPARGEVRLDGKAVGTLARRDAAQLAAFVPPSVPADFAFRVREIVAMGRTPWLGRFQPEGEADRRAIERALDATDVAALADRFVTELSDGEKKRVFLARAFAQEAPVLVLDEPNANLDLYHAHQLLELVRARVRDGGAAIAALHDLSLAARACDRLLVLDAGRPKALGPPREVLTPALLAETFKIRAKILDDETGLLVAITGIGQG